MPKVKIPTTLRQLTDGATTVDASGSTLREVLADVTARYPQLRERLLDGDGQIRSIVHVFIGEDDVRRLGGTGASVAADDVVAIVPAMAGGAGNTYAPVSELR